MWAVVQIESKSGLCYAYMVRFCEYDNILKKFDDPDAFAVNIAPTKKEARRQVENLNEHFRREGRSLLYNTPDAPQF